MCLISKGRKVEVSQPTHCHEEKLMIMKEKSGEKHVRSSAYLLFCLIKLDGDVPLETHITGIIKHPEAGNNDWIENSEAHADNSVLREPWWSVFQKTERLNFLIQN